MVNIVENNDFREVILIDKVRNITIAVCPDLSDNHYKYLTIYNSSKLFEANKVYRISLLEPKYIEPSDIISKNDKDIIIKILNSNILYGNEEITIYQRCLISYNNQSDFFDLPKLDENREIPNYMEI